MTFEDAATVPRAAVIALQGLRDKKAIQPGDKVLINGASGSVGPFAVQIAKAFGAEVTGVRSTTKVGMVRSIGADHVTDYTQEDFAEGEQRYDLILDIGGNSSLSRLRRPHPQRGPRHRRRRDRRTVARRQRSPDLGAPAVPVRGPEADRQGPPGEPRGPDRPRGSHRIPEGHTGHRQDVPSGRGPRSHPLSRRRTRARKSRRCLVRRDKRRAPCPETPWAYSSEVGEGR